MTVYAQMTDNVKGEEFQTDPTDQVVVTLFWESRGKWYTISRVTITHNPEFPTPAISVYEPQAGIRFTVYDLEGDMLYTNKKNKDRDSE